MKIIVGSTNPVKINSVREVFRKYFPDCEVVGVEVLSGVGEQPTSEEETRQGASNRARSALGNDANFGVGLEGGVCEIGGKLFECAWVSVVRPDGEEGMGGGLYFELPKNIAERIRKGEELGPVMAEILKYDVKRSEGAIGVFSGGKLTRQKAYEQLVTQAILKFVSPKWYG